MVKFLGIHIDRELRWKEQMAAALGKGQDWLGQCSRIAKLSGGISGQHMHQLYLSVVRPQMLYRADMLLGPSLWSASFKVNKGGCAVPNKPASVQRRPAILIISRMHMSPTDMLVIHANLLPLHLLVDKAQFQAVLHLATLPTTHPLHNPVKQAASKFIKKHHTLLHEMMHTFKLKLDQMEKISAV
jgi:hypothetical protein